MLATYAELCSLHPRVHQMSLHPDFPVSPYEPLIPEQRWFPADETLRATAYEKLLPPLVANIRREVFAWRGKGYPGASPTSIALLGWWFETDHLLENADGSLSPFSYYFAQREAVETVIWLYDVRKARDKFDLLRYDASGAVSAGMFDEDWPRYVLKMATGAGKTKVLSLLMAWSYFHRKYEPDSLLSRNFLLIAPNIIVLDRLRADFDGLKIFFNDPILPDNGHHGRNWRDDFQMTVHIQDDVRVMQETGNIFLTNIHRVFMGDVTDSTLDDENLMDYFLDPFGPAPSGKTSDSKTDLGEIVREIDELAIFNDEEHHLFVMVDDTRNCDDVGAWLEKTCPELQGAVLVIHTKNNGEISEAASGKNKEELEKLRKQSNEIDSLKSPYKAIVSVLMLKEGWDVKNVTTIVGLRAYVAQSNILPEQTLGRGLRRMYFGTDQRETVSVMGTPAFMEFVESIQSEGVSFEQVPMGAGAKRKESLIVEVDTENTDKDLEALDIQLPRLSRRFHRQFKELDALDPSALSNNRIPVKPFSDEETREIIFKTMLDSTIHHTILLDGTGSSDYRSVVGFFANQLLKDLRLVGGYDVLYGKVKTFLKEHLFEGPAVDLEDPVILRNLSEPDTGKILYDSFKAGINALTVTDTGTTVVVDYIRLSQTRPFRTDHRPYLEAKKSIFTRIVGEAHAGGLELEFAAFLEQAPDVAAHAKNYLAVGFKIDYVKADGDLSNYIPDFIVRDTAGTVWIIETKGQAELDLPQKMARLRLWCADATAASAGESGVTYRFVYVDQKGFEKHPPGTFAALTASFTEYQE